MPERPMPEPLPTEAFDSHCHLDMLDEPVAGVVAAARDVGIRRIVTIGCDGASSRWAAGCAAEHDDVYAAVAIHPNEASGAGEEALDEMARLAELPEVRAIGETGLDYYRHWAAPADQRRFFRGHIEIAKRTGKTLVIHDRDAHEDVLAVLEDEGAPERVVFHCFSGDTEMAKTCAAGGYVMSFAGNVTFKNAVALREAAAVVPPDLLLVETDAPFLTPTPHRGRPNAPHLIPYTMRCLAQVRGVDVAELGDRISANGARLFGPW